MHSFGTTSLESYSQTETNKDLQRTVSWPSMGLKIHIPGKSFVNAKTLHMVTETRL